MNQQKDIGFTCLGRAIDERTGHSSVSAAKRAEMNAVYVQDQIDVHNYAEMAMEDFRNRNTPGYIKKLIITKEDRLAARPRITRVRKPQLSNGVTVESIKPQKESPCQKKKKASVSKKKSAAPSKRG